MVVPDPDLIAQFPNAPVSVRLSAMAEMDDALAIALFVVMSDKDGKVLARHQIGSFEEVVEVAKRLVDDATSLWPLSAEKCKLEM